ncbi:MAG: hypothetical protein GY862_31130 [Gammaproteobacteria bacterium]|nr:hypothetical protein [Gammaproteobacteria bacterium]
MTCFNWLHLTDIHQGPEGWQRSGAKEQFHQDLQQLHNECGPWDLVLLTGDLTRHGSADEFRKLDALLGIFSNEPSAPLLLAVPGNHDAVRPDKKNPAVKLFERWHDDQDIQTAFWEEADSFYRQAVIEAFANYSVWWKLRAPQTLQYRAGMLPGDFSISIEKNGAKLGIVGLNTAFLQLTDRDYKGKLALHARQFHAACGTDGIAWAKQHHTCLLLTHHPGDWLDAESRQHLHGEITAHSRFAVHLCGHTHEAAYQNITMGGADARHVWQGRSLFGLEFFGKDMKRRHGYSAGRIEIKEEQGILTFWPREGRMQGGQRSFAPDYSLDLTDAQHTRPLVFPLISPLCDDPDIAKLSNEQSPPPEPKKAPLYNVPALPRHYLERNEHLDQAIKLLLQGMGKNVGITGISRSVGLQGMGGIGKSILAAALAYDNRIRAAFPDGIVWISLGQTPDIISAQTRILENFEISPEAIPENPQQGKSLLNKQLADKKILLILDDVWSVKDAGHFDIFAASSKLLITTRHAQVLKGISAEECRIDILSDEQALHLLRVQSGWTDTLPEEAAEIVGECGALPLAISMIGAMLRSKPLNRWQRVLKHLRNAELQKIRQKFVNYPYPDLFKALHVSVETLPSLLQERYLELAVFPEDTPIPESVLEIYWDENDLQHYDALEVIDELLDASLIFRHDESSLMLHDLQRDYLHSQCADIKQCHNKLIDAYAKAYPEGWHTIPPNEKPYYFHNNLVFHLKEAGNDEKARDIAETLLNKQPLLPWLNVLICAELMNKTPKQIARQLIKTNNSPNTLIHCIKILDSDAKNEARRLLREHQDANLIAVCLKLLGAEAQDEARQLLREHQDTQVIIACLKLLGEEAKDEARRLLREHQDTRIIVLCLQLLGAEVQDEARQLLREHQDTQVIIACLKLLGEEAKDEARRLLREHQDTRIIVLCLQLLGAEAKDEAPRLIKEYQGTYIITACLRLLGEEAKDEAQRLIREHKNVHVITICLSILGKDAVEFALEKLKSKEWDLLDQSLKAAILRVPVNSPIRQKKALEILSKWQGFWRHLVAAALDAFDKNPGKVTEYCRQIMKQWQDEISYCIQKKIPKMPTHIIMAMNHPDLQDTAKLAAFSMILKEKQQPGFLDEELRQHAQNILDGKCPPWGRCALPPSAISHDHE